MLIQFLFDKIVPFLFEIILSRFCEIFMGMNVTYFSEVTEFKKMSSKNSITIFIVPKFVP